MQGSWVLWYVLDLLGCSLSPGTVKVDCYQQPALTQGWAVYRVGGKLCPVQDGEVRASQDEVPALSECISKGK